MCSRPSAPSDGTCAISWLPAVTLDYIITMVADCERADMRETCLVASAWRQPSQAQLWMELVFLPITDLILHQHAADLRDSVY